MIWLFLAFILIFIGTKAHDELDAGSFFCFGLISGLIFVVKCLLWFFWKVGF